MLSEDGRSYEVIGAGEHRLRLTDADITPALERIEASLAQLDDQRRRDAAASQDEFWHRRHEIARQWVAENPASANPSIDKHPVDAFVEEKIENALAASAGADADQAEHFHGEVLPLLREQCFRCHGEKDQRWLEAEFASGGTSRR